MSENYRAAHLGKTVPVLFEEMSGGLWTGHTPSYLKVYAKGDDLHNKECNVTLTALYQDGLLGNIL